MSRFGFRIGLSHKILAIGAVGTAGLLLVAAVYFTGARSLASYQRTSDDAAAIGALMDKVSIELLQLRQAEKNFLIQGLARFSDRHNDIAASTRRNLVTLKEKLAASGHPNLLSKTDTVGALVNDYVGHFRALVEARKKLGLDQDSGLEGKLKASVGAIESELDKFDDTRLEALVLRLRHHEKDFMLHRDPKLLDEMKKTASELALAIRIATIPPRTKEVFAEKLETYQRDFAAYVEASQLVVREQRAMLEAYNKVDPELETIVKRVDAVSSEARQAADETRASTTFRIQIALITIILAVGALSLLIGRSISKPLRALTVAMRRLGGGDFDVVLPGLGRKDEIGDIAGAVEAFKANAMEKAKREADELLRRQAAEAQAQVRAAEERARQAAEQARVVEALAEGLRSLSAGDLTHRLDEDFPEAYRQVRDDFNAAIAGLQETVAAIAASAREVAGAAGEISTGTTDLSQRTEEQAASLEETSASMEQMSATVKKNAQNADQANAFTRSTREVGNRAGEVVTAAVGAMSRIEESSRRIADIINVIDEIARQTNLLALNAAVEAARAGEAGRGFGVVAAEVRSLAQRSSQAAKDIKQLITGSSTQVQEGVDLVNRAGASLNEMIASVQKISDIVSEIASASGEQASGIDQINKALTQMDEVTQQNSALVEQNAASAKTLEQQSHAMDERMGFFRIETVEAAAPARRPRRVA